MNMPMTDREGELLSATIMMLCRFKGLPNYRWLEQALRMLRVKFNLGSRTASVNMASNDKLKGLDWFEPLYEACKKRLVVKMDYLRFDRAGREPEKRVVEPYQLRAYNNRWYLVGHEERLSTRLPYVVIPVDRIVDLDVESVELRDIREKECGRFAVPSDEKIDAYFKDIVGMSRCPEGKPEPVQVKAWGLAAHYIETKPVHRTQKVVDEGEGWKVFQWFVIPNEELVQQLIVYADQLEIENEWVRKKVVERAVKMLRNNKATGMIWDEINKI